jgi:hypothetical protein
MTQQPHQSSILQWLVFLGEIIVGLLLIWMNLSQKNVHYLSYGIFLIVFASLQATTFAMERNNKTLATGLRWLTLFIVIVFAILILVYIM